MKINFKEKFGKFKNVLRTTPLEVFLGAALGASVAVYGSYLHESQRAKCIPLGFSEISQIENDARYSGEEVGPITRYLASTNDATMKIFEAWNKSHEYLFNLDSLDKRFAKELELKIDRSFEYHHYSLKDLLNAIPKNANDSLNKMSTQLEANNKMSEVNQLFEKAWDDSHRDSYRTEIYSETVSDSEGRTHTEMRTREVYDHTTHTYDYYPKYGENASISLDKVLIGFPDITVKEKIRTTSKTNADGEYAADKSRKNEKRKQRLNQDELTQIANTWNHGSTYQDRLHIIYNAWNELHKDAPSWKSAKNSANSDSYITYSHYDDGPREFQIAEKIKENGIYFSRAIQDIYNSISTTREKSTTLNRKIDDLISINLNSKSSSSNRLTQEILETAKNIYKLNYDHGFKVEQFRYEMLGLFGVIGAAIGAGIGFGLDFMGNKKRWYGNPCS